MKIPIITNDFWDSFETNFDTDFSSLYRLRNTESINRLINSGDNLFRTDKDYDYRKLYLPIDNEYENSFENIVLLHSQLKDLSVVEAADPRIWIALENTDFLDYHLQILKIMKTKDGKKDASIKSRSTFRLRGVKRSLAINNISSLWWIGHLMYDDSSDDDHYHFVRSFTKTDFRGNFVGMSSSNVIDNDTVRMGIFDAVFELIDKGIIIQNRYAFSEANKIMNFVGGIRLLDFLTRDEVKNIILEQLPKQLLKR